MAAVLRLAVLALLLACGLAGCEQSPEDISSSPPVNQSCRAVCCFEFESPCATSATSRCEGCDYRCEGACVDGGPLLRCMEAAGAVFECPSNAEVAPPSGVCRAEFDAYQAAASDCRLGRSSVGFSRP